MRTTGMVIDTGDSSLNQDRIVTTPKINPISMLPESPRKTLAGGQVVEEEAQQSPSHRSRDDPLGLIAGMNADSCHRCKRNPADR
jgi:hypothetical protein